jgi:hypothetical protein
MSREVFFTSSLVKAHDLQECIREDRAPAWDGRITANLAAATESTPLASLAGPPLAFLNR